jgi:hypothetical protein
MLKLVKERNILIRYLNDIFKVKAGMERIIYVLFLFILLCHIASCLWYFIAKLEGFQPETWIVKHGFQDVSIPDVKLNHYFKV